VPKHARPGPNARRPIDQSGESGYPRPDPRFRRSNGLPRTIVSERGADSHAHRRGGEAHAVHADGTRPSRSRRSTRPERRDTFCETNPMPRGAGRFCATNRPAGRCRHPAPGKGLSGVFAKRTQTYARQARWRGGQPDSPSNPRSSGARAFYETNPTARGAGSFCETNPMVPGAGGATRSGVPRGLPERPERQNTRNSLFAKRTQRPPGRAGSCGPPRAGSGVETGPCRAWGRSGPARAVLRGDRAACFPRPTGISTVNR
jgi:hypothetical protein